MGKRSKKKQPARFALNDWTEKPARIEGCELGGRLPDKCPLAPVLRKRRLSNTFLNSFTAEFRCAALALPSGSRLSGVHPDVLRRMDMTVPVAVRETKPMIWTRRHLLGLEELSREEIVTVRRGRDFVENRSTGAGGNQRSPGQSRRQPFFRTVDAPGPASPSRPGGWAPTPTTSRRAAPA